MAPPILDPGPASLAASLVLGILCVARIRACDARGREPLVRLFLVALYGGVLAAALSLLGYRLAGAAGFAGFHAWYGFLLFVGPIEEGAKYLGLRASRLVHGRRPDDAAGGMVRMASVALGFSLVENFLHANAGIGNAHLLWLRLALSTPAHILFSFPMGLAYALGPGTGRPRAAAAAGFVLACLAHALYNTLAALPWGILAAPAFLVLLGLPLLLGLRRAPARPLPSPAPGGVPAMAAALPAPGPARRRDLVLAALGVALCAAWGLRHLDSRRPASQHPALSRTWEDSTLSVAYPDGWNLSVWTSGDGREVSLSLEAGGRAAMSIRSQAWEVVPRDAADAALSEVLGGLGAAELSRRPLANWGRFAGAGSDLAMRSSRGRDLGLAVFAHSAGGRSFVALEMVEAAYREPLRPGMEMVRRTLRLKGRRPPTPTPAPPGAAPAGFAPGAPPRKGSLSAGAAGIPSAASEVTRMLRRLVGARDTASAP